MPGTAGTTHHITISDVAGTNKTGFMLARRRGRDLAYAVEDAEQVQPRVLSQGELTEAEAPVQLRMYWSMEDWRAGVGGIVDRQHKLRLASATLIDTTARNALRPAHAFTVSTVDNSASTIIASGFWTVGTELWAGVGRDVYIWDFDNNRWDDQTEPVNASRIYRNGVEFEGRTYVPAWDTTIDLPEFYLHKRDFDTGMTLSTITKKPKYIVQGRNLAGDLALWGGFCLFGSGVILNDGTDINSTDTALVVDGTSAVTAFTVGDFITMDQEIMRITVITDATNITVVRGELNSTAASHVDDTELYDYFPHGIMTSTTPNSSWGNILKVGTIDAEITALVKQGEVLIICKTDGIWTQLRNGTVTNRTPQFESQQHPDNFRGAFNWNGHIILPLGGSGDLFEFFNGDLFDISIKNYAPQVTEWHGPVAAVGGDPTHLYILVDDSANTKYHVLMAEWRSFEGRLDWRWHHIGEISYNASSARQYATIFAEAQQDTDGTNPHHRVWFGIESTSPDTTHLPYFSVSSDVDEKFAYSNSSTMIAQFPDFDGGFARIAKNCVAVDVDSVNLGAAGRQWTLKYQLDGGAVKTDLTDASGNADGVVDATGGAETLTFPAGTTANILTLQAVPASTAETSTPPEINRIRVTFQLRPDRLRLLPMTFYIADNITLLNGALGGLPNAELAQLRTWDAQAAAVTVVDLEGNSRDYVFLPGNMRIRPRKRRPGRRREFLVDVVLAQE